MTASRLPAHKANESAEARSARSDTYERLLMEAAGLFRQRGYEGTSTRALAERLGIQKASLYHHMANKEQLLYEMAVRSMDRMDARIRAELEDRSDPVERLGTLIESHVAAMLEQPDPYAASLLELRALTGEHAERLVKRRDDYEKMLGRMIQAAQETGAVRSDMSPQLIGLLILGTMNWTLFWYRPDGPVPPRELAAAVRTLVLDGLIQATGEQ